ncbi:MAG: peptidase, partial [Alphaproteobacteria bacterium]|nr:peptidase [Alphaproteobacteria bacterium]
DTRTNAGVDHIATFRKMHIWKREGERVLVLMSAGNLSLTQTVVSLLNEGIDVGEDDETLLSVSSMFGAARLVGKAVQQVREMYGKSLEAEGGKFNVSFILGGQIQGRTMRLFHIYDAGNFIEATRETPYFQIGETKYGKPILDRVLKFDLSLKQAEKLALLSMDSTLRSNISVGMPLDLIVVERDTVKIVAERRVEEDDFYFEQLRTTWSTSLQQAFHSFPDPGD